jgi:hypothetical protein
MSTTVRRYSKEELAQMGDAIYERDVRPKMTPADRGRFAAIDVDTSEYEIADTELDACRRLRQRQPDAQMWLVRIGSRYLHRFGHTRS